MEIVSTIVSEKAGKATVEMVIADKADPALATVSVSFRVVIPSDKNPLLAHIQHLALRQARDAIAEQMRATSARANLD